MHPRATGQSATARHRIWAAGAAIALALSFCLPAEAQVYLRGRTEPLPGAIVSVSAEGVLLKAPTTPGVEAKPDTLVAWDVIRSVAGPSAKDAEPFVPLATRTWRARTRLERSDFEGAEPIFEALAMELKGQTGPTAAVVFEGLCRCRLARGAQAQAVAAWLDWVRATSLWNPATVLGGAIRAESGPVIDSGTGLLFGAPPIVAGEDAAALARLLEDTTRWESPDGTAADFAMLYRGAARYETGLDPELGSIRTAREGVRLVRDIVVARAGDSDERAEARTRLTERLKGPDTPAWLEAWARCAVGRSLLRDDDVDRKRQGMVQMLHVPARFSRVTPALAGLAVAECAVWSARLGDSSGAGTLKLELLRAFPRHPANAWGDVRDIAPPAAPGGNAQSRSSEAAP